MKKVAILTSFTSADCAYSLNNVVQDQIKMLTSNGYKPIVIAQEGFKPVENYALEKVDMRYVPSIRRSNQIEIDDSFDPDVEATYSKLNEILDGVDVVITHDLIYQPAELKTHVACRRIAAENPRLRWLHWIHSATAPMVLLDSLKLSEKSREKYEPFLKDKFPNSFVVFPNAYSRKRIAMNFGYEQDEVKCVHHPTDLFTFLGMHPMTEALARSKRLLEADLICVYPIRLDRGKNVEVPIEIMAQAKKKGMDVRMVVVDFHSTGGDKVVYREELRKLAQEKGLTDIELTFTSQFDSSLEARCPRQMVKDLFQISNVFIMASRSESYSLITQEASLCGNVILLNRDFPPFIDIFGDAPYQGQFSSAMDALTGLNGETSTNYGSRDDYMSDMAGMLIYEVKNNRVIRSKDRARKLRNLDYVFRHELEPLIDYYDGKVVTPEPKEPENKDLRQDTELL